MFSIFDVPNDKDPAAPDLDIPRGPRSPRGPKYATI